MRQKPSGFMNATIQGFAGSFAPTGFIASSTGLAVTRDATSGIYVPSSSAEWSAFISYFGLSIAVPTSLYLLQEASGNPADSIGACPLTAAGTVTYQQTLPGWSRKGVGLTDGVNSQFASASVSLPTGGAASQTVLMFASVPAAPAANRELYVGQTGSILRLNSTPRVVAISGGNVATGTNDYTPATRPYAYKEDNTGAVATVYTNQEKLTPVHAANSGRNLRIGSATVAPGGVVGYAVAWYNANAEISDANMKALLQALGWTIPW